MENNIKKSLPIKTKKVRISRVKKVKVVTDVRKRLCPLCGCMTSYTVAPKIENMTTELNFD